ncbi:MAG: MBL fold metallo-hydrolase RNA specificity domain-containing protein [Dehalococcoidales bacterium]|nr:MBL fold metallo-hydrolase RNA specificity domain-containing protein [Dehalococcoidales bacterium]
MDTLLSWPIWTIISIGLVSGVLLGAITDSSCDLPSIRPAPGSLYVYSSSEPHGEEREMDFRRLHNWLDHFGINKFGIPVEVNGKWEIPEEEKGLHASGHAYGPDLLNIVREIKPQILIPVHSEYPEYYTENLGKDGVIITYPRLGVPITL